MGMSEIDKWIEEKRMIRFLLIRETAYIIMYGIFILNLFFKIKSGLP